MTATSNLRLADLTRRQSDALVELLLAAVGAYGRAEECPDLAELVERAPVELLPAAARLHRVSGVVLQSCASTPNVPVTTIEQLDSRRLAVQRRHLVSAAALRAITESFQTSEIRWVAMKGPVLASRLYNDPGDREYGDLDLLIDRHALPRAVDLLESAGYEHRIQNWPLARWYMASEFDMRSPLIEIDVHWHLVYSDKDRAGFSVDPAAMIERSLPAEVAGFDVPSFEPTDMLLHLAFHAARSGGHRLVWLKDIERCLALTSPDLDLLVERAHRSGCGPSVSVALDRARLVGADVPEQTLRDLAGHTLLRGERIVRRWSGSVRLHEKNTAARSFSRSLRRSLTATAFAPFPRGAHAVRRRLLPLPGCDNDDAAERTAFMQAVARS